jgi:GLPGLI family protein
MKKTTLYLFLFTLLFSKGVAQSILIEYEEIRLESNINNHFEVWITDSVTTMIGKSPQSHSFPVPYLKHKKLGFTYRSEVGHGQKGYDVKDSLHNFKWELLPDTATILKRKCMAAKTTFRGREYKVFYTPEIPVSDGPWKLGGLPGLILEAKTTDGYIEWHAIKLDLAYKEKYTYPDLSKNTYLDWQAYTEAYKKGLEEMIYKIRSNEAFKGKGGKMRYKKSSLEIFHPESQINGIEIEID